MGPEPTAPDGAPTDLEDAYTAAHNAFMAHVASCDTCRRRGIDCQTVAPIKTRLKEARSARIAARTAGQ